MGQKVRSAAKSWLTILSGRMFEPVSQYSPPLRNGRHVLSNHNIHSQVQERQCKRGKASDMIILSFIDTRRYYKHTVYHLLPPQQASSSKRIFRRHQPERVPLARTTMSHKPRSRGHGHTHSTIVVLQSCPQALVGVHVLSQPWNKRPAAYSTFPPQASRAATACC